MESIIETRTFVTVNLESDRAFLKMFLAEVRLRNQLPGTLQENKRSHVHKLG